MIKQQFIAQLFLTVLFWATLVLRADHTFHIFCGPVLSVNASETKSVHIFTRPWLRLSRCGTMETLSGFFVLALHFRVVACWDQSSTFAGRALRGSCTASCGHPRSSSYWSSPCSISLQGDPEGTVELPDSLKIGAMAFFSLE